MRRRLRRTKGRRIGIDAEIITVVVDAADSRVESLIALLTEVRERVSSSDANAFVSWTVDWEDVDEALSEIDALLESVRSGRVPRRALGLLFAPTAPLQDLSIAAGWADEYLALAARGDRAMASLVN